MHQNKFVFSGKELTGSSRVLIMIHGRGGSAEDIVTLASHLEVADFTLIAPQATNNTWYPYSFLAPPEQNEPWLSSALAVLDELVTDLGGKGVPSESIYFLGFSQGACLTLEFVTRNARRWGGVVSFTGGLIGDKIRTEHYKGDFQGTPVFIGTSDPDLHVPVERVYATANILRDRNAAVTEKVYAQMGHTVNRDELILANRMVFNSGGA